jgi:hypothetical protein
MGEERLGFKKGPAEFVIEKSGNIAGELHMLDLVLAYGHEIASVEEYVCGLEHGVIKQSHIDILFL